jgi:hypothetical protein
MDDLDKYIAKKKKSDKKFAETFDLGYREFKVGALLSLRVSNPDLVAVNKLTLQLA